ncbi:MAG: glycosyltransferase [archaeon YNP-LCB-003-016]|uniref:glycosyltransferase n=1 Tax=Candidatus Culexarchaeum yellowstonense TaxID=2928963 RepID=UPI0026F060EC|nr:glycosyltransferase [Candidatus Culexarchaeum yellowstonense]MCR6691289.1 glycosyltransferase [Candidatus Culexarchaeum yellowstonense]
MRILVVQTTDWIRRNPAQQHHLMEILSLRGHKIRVIDFELLWKEKKGGLFSRRRIFNNVRKIYKGASVTVIRPSFIRFPILDYLSILLNQFKEIMHQINDFSPDVIVSFGVVACIAGKVAKRKRIPFVYYWIDVTHRLIPFKLLQPIGWLMEREAIKLADKIFVINKKLMEYVIRNKASPSKVVVLGAGIDLRRFDPNTINSSIIRKRFELKNEDIVLLFMGWLYKFSGLKEVAMELTKHKNVKLLVVGDGDLYKELQEIRDKYNIQDRLLLLGRRPYSEIPELIAASDICILPAYPNEPIMIDIVPIKIYEYMAMAKPVISTKLPGVMKEFGLNNGIVYVERPEDVVNEAIKLAINNDVKDLGRRARNFVEKYEWNNIANDFEKILIDLKESL